MRVHSPLSTAVMIHERDGCTGLELGRSGARRAPHEFSDHPEANPIRKWSRCGGRGTSLRPVEMFFLSLTCPLTSSPWARADGTRGSRHDSTE